MKRNVLLVGGSGFLGSNLAHYLRDQGDNVYVFDREIAADGRFTGFESNALLVGDATDPDEVVNVVQARRIDVIHHLAGAVRPQVEEENFLSEINTSITPTIRLMHRLTGTDIELFVFYSSGGTIYGAGRGLPHSEEDATIPLSVYGWSKLTTERAISLIGTTKKVPFLIVRPSNPFGRWQRGDRGQGIVATLINRITKNQEVEIWGDGTMTRDYIYARDLCALVYRLVASNARNSVFNIGTGQGTTVQDLIAKIEQVMGKKARVCFKSGRNIDVSHNVLNNQSLINQIGGFSFTEFDHAIKATIDSYTS